MVEGIRVKHRYIEGRDAENIVRWRNANAEFFPPQEPWTAEGHLRWYAKYLQDMNDFVYMVCTDEGVPVGTIGVTRVYNRNYEIGRVLLGEREMAPPGIMSEALQAVMAKHEGDFYRLKVLHGNDRAVRFYRKNGFGAYHYDETYLYMARSYPT